jgi:hypothetical protein
MAEEKKEKWMTYMAITTILIAVAATLSTFKGGGFSTRSLLIRVKALRATFTICAGKTLRSRLNRLKSKKGMMS